jgi:hypothetical protein
MWNTPVIPAIRRLDQEDHESKASLAYSKFRATQRVPVKTGVGGWVVGGRHQGICLFCFGFCVSWALISGG